MNTRRVPPLLVVLTLFLIATPTHRSPAASLSYAKARLGLIAVPKYGPFPLTVQFQAQIHDADEHDPDLYCLVADWDFDHIRFFDRRDCPPFEEGTKIQTRYFTSHTFELPGTYRVRLTLRRGNDLVLRDDVWIRVSSARDEASGAGSIDITSTPIRAEVSDLLRSPVEYLYRPIIVKGRLGDLSALDGQMLALMLHDRRSWEKTIRLRVLGGRDLGIPIGDEVEVTGVLRSENPVGRDDWRLLEPPEDIYIEADSIDSLENDVKAPADLPPLTALPPPKPTKSRGRLGPPPEVLFTLPLDQERGINLDTEFRVQFSDDMNPNSFAGNVVVEYADENEPVVSVELSYDKLSRTLTVKPETLLPAREVRLSIFEGVVNEEGAPLLSTFVSRRASLDRKSGRMKALTLTFFTRE